MASSDLLMVQKLSDNDDFRKLAMCGHVIDIIDSIFTDTDYAT